jgi:hypothetical protein
MKNALRITVLALIVSATVTTTYAITCFGRVYQQQCVAPGQCYGSCTPAGCSQSTCLTATSYGYENGQFNVNVYVGGTIADRGWDGTTYNTCFVSSCKVYNGCTQQYEAPPAWCSCNLQVKAYTGYPTGCPEASMSGAGD